MQRRERASPPEQDLPMRRVAGLWAWLPAFRAVAETEHLRRAARYLALSPPALSRSLKLLEEAVGHPLFLREGRRLRLTDQGTTLLLVVRRAMRAVDDATNRPAGPLRLHTLPSLASLLGDVWRVAPQGLALRTQALGVAVHSALLRGLVDVAVVPETSVVAHKEISVWALGSLSWGIYQDAARVATIPDAVSIGAWDGWPADRPRTVVAETDDVAAALAMARSGLAVALPSRLAPKGLKRVGPGWKIALAAMQRSRPDAANAVNADAARGDAIAAALRRALRT